MTETSLAIVSLTGWRVRSNDQALFRFRCFFHGPHTADAVFHLLVLPVSGYYFPIFFRWLRTDKDSNLCEKVLHNAPVLERSGKLLSDAERIVPFGNFLCRSCRYELPGLPDVLMAI